jgi:hypothetical protein
MAKAAAATATVRPGLRFLDRLILFVAWIVTCGLVYGLGFYTGKGTQERRLGMEERVVRLPVTSPVPPEGQRPKASNEFSFYETLATQRGADGGRPRDLPRQEPVAAAPAPAPAPSAAAGEPLPHPATSPGEPKPPAIPSGAPKPPVPSATGTGAPTGAIAAGPTGAWSASGATRGTPAPTGAVAKPTLPTPLGAPKPAAVPTGQLKPPVRAVADEDGVIPPTPRSSTPIATAPAAARTGGTAAEAPARPTTTAPGAMVALAKPTTPPAAAAPKKPAWTVQASPTRDKKEADRLLAALKAKGYDANVVTVKRDGDVWYRLRVGRYATPEQATEAMRKLRGAGVSHAFVASE